jgi:thymidylate synthase
MQTITDIRNHFITKLEDENFIEDRLGGKTIELIGASFLADEPAIFGEPNKEYVDREIDWYMRMSTNINDIYVNKVPPKAWKYAADKHGNINSNYGKLIFDELFHNQYDNVVAELEANPDTRRACMIYNRPSIWTEYNEGGKDDFICTNTVTYYLRDRVHEWSGSEDNATELDCVVQMRSNDVIFGYRNDWAWQQYILKYLCNDLGDYITPGKMIWQVQNLHVYEKHFLLVEQDIENRGFFEGVNRLD